MKISDATAVAFTLAKCIEIASLLIFVEQLKKPVKCLLKQFICSTVVNAFIN